MKKIAVYSVLVALCFLSGSAFAADTMKGKIPCTVCGYLMDKNEMLRTEYEAKTYYFCEAGCKAYFLKDPAAFAAGIDMDPVCGMTVKKEGSIEVIQGGRQMHFCSNECKDKYFAAPADYEINYDVVSNEVKPQKEMKFGATFEGRPYSFVSEENKAAFEKNPGAYIYAECPVTGKVFLRKDAGATTEYKGTTYYFCCKDCLKKFNKYPKKYLMRATSVEGGADVKSAKEGTGSSAEMGCPMKKAGGCPKAKTCTK